MRIIGITGPSGAGKSLLCQKLTQKGIPCIDADRVYHSLLIPPSSCLDALRSAFGDGIFSSDGALDRKSLGKIVFSDPAQLALLNSTVLGFVLEKVREMIEELSKAGHGIVAVDAPTLIESGFNKECDTVISVLAPPSMRTERIMKRDGIERDKAELRIQAQKDDSFYIAASDAILTNGGDIETFERHIAALLENIG